jgi:hypothetical protein
MIVTYKLLDRIKTGRGGYTRIQIETLGLTWPIEKGWKDLAVGNIVKDWRILFYERDKYYPASVTRQDIPVYKTERSDKKLDKSFADTWKTRSEFLDIPYSEFINSEYWRRVKKKALSRGETYRKCRFCGCTHSIELHHTSYKWINTKNELRSIVPLCRTHHQMVHDYAKANNVSVRIATNTLKNNYDIHR